MSNSQISTTSPAMVAADTIVYSGLATVSKVIGAGAIAKATGSKVGIVKAEHYAKQGAALAFAACHTGKGKGHAVAVYAAAEADKLVNQHGVIEYYRAITTVASVLGESLTFTESIRADGQRVVKRADWLAIGEQLALTVSDTATAKAKAKRYSDALAVYTAIQSRADTLRAPTATPAAIKAPAAIEAPAAAAIEAAI